MPPLSIRSALLLPALILALPSCADPECGPDEIQVADSCYKRAKRDAGAVCDAGECAPPEDEAVDAQVRDASAAARDSASIPTNLDANQTVADAPSRGAAEAPDSGIVAPDAAATEGVCPPNACGDGGICTAAGSDWMCTCADGFRGTGTKSCVDIDECAERNVCTHASWPCVQTGPGGYTCQGRFAEWPIADSTVPSAPKPKFTATDETVLDENTGLMWQRRIPPEYEGCTCSGSCGGTQGTQCTHREARAYCAQLTLAGHDDWRLPGIAELDSIVDFAKLNEAAVRFVNNPAEPVWALDVDTFPPRSQETAQSDAFYGWWADDARWSLVYGLGYLGHGSDSDGEGGGGGMLRCVRTARERPAARRPETRFIADEVTNTTMDTWTGLRWERALPVDFAATYAIAHTRCRNAGMRVPTRKELLSLVDPAMIGAELRGPTIDRQAFPSTPSTKFWSTSIFPEALATSGAPPSMAGGGTELRFTVSFLDGSSTSSDPSLMHAVRCIAL